LRVAATAEATHPIPERKCVNSDKILIFIVTAGQNGIAALAKTAYCFENAGIIMNLL
jgi:hypothetical protein